jgi:hypothetical protein
MLRKYFVKYFLQPQISLYLTVVSIIQSVYTKWLDPQAKETTILTGTHHRNFFFRDHSLQQMSQNGDLVS